ncbi:MAG: 1-acyl-sn-glycerol-3-phosphate acyltransferase [Dysgonomonas sp.]
MDQDQSIYIDLDKIFKTKAPSIYKKTPRFLISYLKRKVHLDEINNIIRYADGAEGVDFMKKTVEYFGIKLNIQGLDKIPQDGHYIFASNHPLGGLDGICLSTVIGDKFDNKVKYIVNDLLYNIKPLQNIFIPVNKIGSQSKSSIASQVEAFSSDNQIITFPAGLCSRRQNGEIKDLEWKKTFITKAIENKRDVVPVFFEGRNSNFFYRFANLRQRLGIKFNLEMLFLPDEMFKCKDRTFNIIFGQPVPYTFFDHTKNPKEWAQLVKEESYKLAKK